MKINTKAFGVVLLLALFGPQAWGQSKEEQFHESNDAQTVAGIRPDCPYCTNGMMDTMVTEPTKAVRARRTSGELPEINKGSPGTGTTEAIREDGK